MKILKGLLFLVVGIVILALLVALFVKKDYAVEREVTINKPVAVVFDYIKHIKNQDQYSVWNRLDPASKKTYTGTDGTVGFISGWESTNKNVGKGEQEITSITEGDRIDMKLRFKEPFEAEDEAYMATESMGENQTKVKWGFKGRMAYPMNLMLLFMDMEGMLGKDLQGGLDTLKTTLEK
ncbi:SRPBCC family protein [Pedobacter hiemivivus]|uniref:Polyketide cyclase n=1 Tax=Pedobacter hiemivivus TaxID=2530454 RepID=A0A4R0NCP3_9SPHI|nr:SRPBCC family protein [Pedobacter hiemivivus]TCC96993.1 polyketide cyclase [Pedobacter hiemivivus]